MRWRQDKNTLELVPADEAAYNAVHMVMPDIAPYKSMATGEMIESRSKHHEHLRRHDLVEIGNEIPTLMKNRGIPDVDPQGRKETIARQIKGMGHDNFKRALKREIEHIKWNSNNG
tara:strand:+ start:2146 stop:2493 length:348 start_codon:yes stop_codon:yes gene_type:complete